MAERSRKSRIVASVIGWVTVLACLVLAVTYIDKFITQIQ